jgi:hypothetical protein
MTRAETANQTRQSAASMRKGGERVNQIVEPLSLALPKAHIRDFPPIWRGNPGSQSAGTLGNGIVRAGQHAPPLPPARLGRMDPASGLVAEQPSWASGEVPQLGNQKNHAAPAPCARGLPYYR